MTAARAPANPAGRRRCNRSRGFGAIGVIVVLVLLSGMAAAVVRLAAASQTTAAQDLLAARAAQSARAGLQWGLYQALKGSWTGCAGASTTIDMTAENGMLVTVGCASTVYNEGESAPGVAKTVRIYTIDAVACNGSVACPDAGRVTRPGYVERRWQVHATD